MIAIACSERGMGLTQSSLSGLANIRLKGSAVPSMGDISLDKTQDRPMASTLRSKTREGTWKCTVAAGDPALRPHRQLGVMHQPRHHAAEVHVGVATAGEGLEKGEGERGIGGKRRGGGAQLRFKNLQGAPCRTGAATAELQFSADFTGLYSRGKD